MREDLRATERDGALERWKVLWTELPPSPRRCRVRVSEYYELQRDQSQLDFVDVDTFGDTKLFVDPRALRQLASPWARRCVSLVQSFFGEVLRELRGGHEAAAQRLLRGLGEPNETHLGLSRGRSSGRAIGRGHALAMAESLASSEALKTGLLVDLEDTALLVEGINTDKVSDIATNLIRQPLIEYTQEIANNYGIPLVEGVSSGPLWDPVKLAWTESRYVSLPRTRFGKLLLVPKVIVRMQLELNQDEYFRDYIIPFLRERELRAGSELVDLLKDGSRRVTRKSLVEKYGMGKAVSSSISRQHPELLVRYRKAKDADPQPPLEHDELARLEEAEPPDWEQLLTSVTSLPLGREAATAYHRAVESLLTPLFYPSLLRPDLETKLHGGRKRVDITYQNCPRPGFFAWVSRHHRAAYIFVECKNYSGDPQNPELDQLSGRFSPNRGTVGLLVCRRFEDKELFLTRCHDTAADQRGFVIALDDSDLSRLVQERMKARTVETYSLLQERFDRLVL